MSFVCQSCDLAFPAKFNLERHLQSEKHKKNVASTAPTLESIVQNQTLQIQALQDALQQNTEVIGALQGTVGILTNQITVLLEKIDNLQLKGPRHTAAENKASRIEALFNHQRKYKTGADESGFDMLCRKLTAMFAEDPELCKDGLEKRLFDIYKAEIYNDTNNTLTLVNGFMNLMGLKRYIQTTPDLFIWLKESMDEETEDGFMRRDPPGR